MKNKYMKVVGCPNGMDSDDPHLPTKPCMAVCDWRIKSIDFCNCSWVVAETTDGIYDLRKLGEMTGMSHESVRTLVNKTISKLSAQQSESLEGGQEEKIIKDYSSSRKRVGVDNKYKKDITDLFK